MNRLLGSGIPTRVQDLVILAGRVLLGAILIAHGLQKLDTGVAGVAEGFAAMGIPAPELAATFAIVAELGGGVLLVLGLATPVAGVLVALQMAGAFWFAHREAGLFAQEGGWELVAVIGLAGLVLAVVGAGKLSLDWLVSGRRHEARTRVQRHGEAVAA